MIDLGENRNIISVALLFLLVISATHVYLRTEQSIALKTNDYQVGGYAEDVYVYKDYPHEWFCGNGGGKIPNYCKVRCSYIKGDNTTDAERKFIVIAEFLT